MRSLIAGATILTVVVYTLPLIPLQMLATRYRWRLAERLPIFYHTILCRLLGVDVVCRGERVEARPVLFVFNHVSWLDIPVIGKSLPVSFVAKQEVAGYPGVGLLAKLQRSIFIARERRATANHRDEMQARLDVGDNLVLFAEGTSGDGVHILPFKSAFLSVAEREVDGRPLVTQPVTLAYTRLDNLPMTRGSMPHVAWVGDEALFPHIWSYLKGGRIVAELRFHPPVTIDQFSSRKELAMYCRDEIAGGMHRALTGRSEPAMPPSLKPVATPSRA